MSIVIFLFGLFVIATSLTTNGYGVVVGIEMVGAGILLGQNKFKGFNLKEKSD